MGLFDELKRLTQPFDDDGADDDDFDAVPSRKDVREARGSYGGGDDRDRDRERERRNKVVNIHTTTQLQVVLVKPEKFENAAEIADHLKDKRTVVLNLESTQKVR